MNSSFLPFKIEITSVLDRDVAEIWRGEELFAELRHEAEGCSFSYSALQRLRNGTCPSPSSPRFLKKLGPCWITGCVAIKATRISLHSLAL